MVAVTTTNQAPKAPAQPAGHAAGGPSLLSARIDTSLSAITVRNAVVAPAQQPQWLAAWAAEVNRDLFVASLNAPSGEMLLALPLEVVSGGGQKLARFPGGSHANGNFPIVGADGSTISRADIEALLRGIREARPDIDLLSLERMPTELSGFSNPLALLNTQQSPNVSLAVSLEGGFEGALERAPSRKGRRFRAQQRKFEEFGGAHRRIAASEDQVDEMLTAFFAMKAERFRAMGIDDVFAEPQVQAFFRRLFKSGLATRTFSLTALDVAGKLRAVNGHSRCDDRLICEFGAIASDEMSTHSPGDYLFYQNIEAASADGFNIYDFSVGDEPYKRSWCTIEEFQIDVIVPMSRRGRLLSHWLTSKSAVKGMIKSNAVLWPLIKRLRKTVRGG